jgi:uncharacterized protein (TIGR03435 family)
MALLKGFGLPAVLAALVAVAPLTGFGSGPEVGKEAPPLTLSKILQAPPDASANWEALRGQVVVIDFWATWCGPCRKSIPHWNELVDAFKDKRAQFLAITDENEQVVAQFLKRTPIHSWVGLDGVGQSMRDRYRIEGIPTLVLVNQKGVVVAVSHPALLQAKQIEEVIDTGSSSLPPPAEYVAGVGSEGESAERVPANRPAFEVSVCRSGPLPAGHGTDCWETSSTSADASGQYASVKQAILTLFDGRERLLDCRTTLPTERYDFTIRLPGASRAQREEAVAPMFRTAFGLRIRREQAQREVYVLRAVSTNAPGLTLSTPDSSGAGADQSGGLELGSTTIDALPGWLEGRLRKPMVDETGLTNRYDIRLKWNMCKRELLPETMDRRVLEAVEEPDTAKEEKLSEEQRRQLAAIRGKLSEAELQKLSAEDRENAELLRAELAKPDDERFAPEPEAIRAAVREQLGLELSLQRRSLPVLIVEKAAPVD